MVSDTAILNLGKIGKLEWLSKSSIKKFIKPHGLQCIRRHAKVMLISTVLARKYVMKTAHGRSIF